MGANLPGRTVLGEARTAVAARPAMVVAVASTGRVGGTWRARVLPGKAGFKQTRGAGAVWSWGTTRGRPGGRRRRTDAAVGAVQEGAEVGDEGRAIS